MTVRSTHWEKLTEDIIRVTGDLTIKGVSRPLVASVSYNGSNVDMQGNTSYFFSFSTTIDRTLFGMQPAPVTSLGAQLLSNTVNIQAAFSFQILR
jgi:polyisoprenoid-binding protein YceI